jgi:oligopeptide transport system substrate-binding protein
MKRYLFSSISLCVLICIGIGYFKNPIKHCDLEYQKILKLPLRTEPLTLDPRKNSDGITSLFFLFTSEGLTRLSQEGGPELALAKQIDISEDLLTYTFTLRNAYWSNGDPITAYDFKSSWLKVLDPDFGSYNPDYLFVIKHAKQAYERQLELSSVGIETLSENILRVTLEYPTSYFLELITNKIFFPVHASMKRHICSGPFMIKKWIHQDKILLKKNPYYWDKEAVKLDKIDLYIIEDEMTQLSLFEQGKLDWAGAPLSLLPLDSLSQLKQHSCFHSFKTASLYFYNFNTTKFPLDNVKLRKALTYAINRKELIEHVSQGQEEAALALLPSKTHGIHTCYFQDGDTETAKKLFKEALNEMQIKEEDFPTLVLSYPSVYARHVMAQAIQQQWQQSLGIKVVLKSKEWQVFLSDLNQGQYEIAALGRGTHHLDPLYFLSLFKTKQQSSNHTGWENEDYREMLEKSYFVNNTHERNTLLHQAEQVFIEHMPIAPIFFPTHYYLKNSKLQGVFLSDVGSVDFKRAYFD